VWSFEESCAHPHLLSIVDPGVCCLDRPSIVG
jgi:hypothetical protein